MDFWVGTVGLVVFALLEIVLFMWVFGAANAWQEMHKGCDVKIPRAFFFVMKYVTPLYILVLLCAWGFQDGWAVLTMAKVPSASYSAIFLCRLTMLAITAIFLHIIWRRFGQQDQDSILVPIAFWAIPLGVLVLSYPGLSPMKSGGLMFVAASWTFAVSLSVFCIFKMLHVPSRRHDDFPEELGTEKGWAE
jgi:hypothetical protein